MSPAESPLTKPLKGEVCVQFIRCNKPSCRCREGQPHGPYYYRIWREAGRVHKKYVKPENLAATRAACIAYRTLHLHLRDLRRRREQLCKEIQKDWRRTQRVLRHWPGGLGVSAADQPPSPPRTGL